MSDDITSVLLPAARVDIYALDDGTAATAAQLSGDWRFARVEIRVVRAGIEAAIESYAQAASPELIMIETNDIGEGFLQLLGGLAGVCAEGTDAVIVGPTNDVHLYRNLVGMGVKDYLVRPVSMEDMVNVIAKALVEKRGLSGSRLVAVAGSKGGVGCTSVSQLLAWETAEVLGQKTLLMDVAGSSGTIGISYGLEPVTSLTEAARVGASGSEDDMKRILQGSGEHLSLLVCGSEPIMTDSPDPDSIEALVNRLMQKFPVVVVDTSGAAPAVQKRILSRATHVVMVTTPLLPALRNCRTLLGEIKSLRHGIKDVDLVINMQGLAGADEVPAGDIKTALELEAAARIPYNAKIFTASETSGKPVGANKLAQEILKGLAGVAARSAGTEARNVEISAKNDGPLSFLKGLGGKSKNK